MDFALLNAVSNLEKPDGIIALPGADGYALAARLDHPQALARLNRMTGGKNTMLLGRDIDAFATYIESIPFKAFDLMERYWPGPLILMLPKSNMLPPEITSHLQVRLMQPDYPTLMDLLSMTPGGILAAGCACRDGEIPSQTALEVLDTFGDDVDFVLKDDDSILEAGTPTVVSVDSDGTFHLLRSGRIVLD